MENTDLTQILHEKIRYHGICHAHNLMKKKPRSESHEQKSKFPHFCLHCEWSFSYLYDIDNITQTAKFSVPVKRFQLFMFLISCCILSVFFSLSDMSNIWQRMWTEQNSVITQYIDVYNFLQVWSSACIQKCLQVEITHWKNIWHPMHSIQCGNNRKLICSVEANRRETLQIHQDQKML